MSPVEPTPRRALVAYWSRFGNTRRIAEAIARGLRSAPGLAVDCRPIEEVDPESLLGYELLAIGAPTEIFSAPRAMKEFLAKLPARALAGRRGFAFDTRLEGRLKGSAGRFIDRQLDRLGVVLVRRHASAFVRGMTAEERAVHGSEGAPAWVQRFDPSHPPPSTPSTLDLLLPGAEDEFERIGTGLARGRVLVAA